MLGFGMNPDGSGDCFIEPYNILATNDRFPVYIARFGADNAAQPTGVHGLRGQFEVPQNYSSAADLVIIWTATLTSGNVKWDIRYRSIGGNDTESLDQVQSGEKTATGTDAAPGAANRRLEFTIDLTDGDFSPGETVLWKLDRDGADAADTMAGSAILFDARFKYSD
jgi:hypothetical protein